MNAHKHTLTAVTLTAQAAIERGLTFDPSGLRQALEAPEFLASLDHNGASSLFSAEDWEWWLDKGRSAPNFDVHLRLGHLRDRLGRPLDLPEYSVLWQAPYLDLLEAIEARTALFWRLPDRDGRRRVYITSLFASLTAALHTRSPEERPLLLFFHNLDPGSWAERLHQLPTARLFLSGEKMATLPTHSTPLRLRSGQASAEPALNLLKGQAQPRPQTLIVSRLGKEDAERLYTRLPGTRAADLRRLPPGRLIIRRGDNLGTADMRGA